MRKTQPNKPLEQQEMKFTFKKRKLPKCYEAFQQLTERIPKCNQ